MSLKSVRGLKIEKLQAKLGYYYEFKTPLWLSSDSNRYESLLNSLIGNAVMHHKMPGNAFVAGSESGFAYSETMEGIEESDVIYLDNYNGKELQGTHTTSENGEVKFHKAQVFVTSKFKDNNNELIDLFEGFDLKSGSVANAKYLKRNENGSLGLKEGMIDPMLFNNFSFRTPTSSHVSGSSIEIAGILPAIQGDLMIVPKNFTKQKGLDYDVDKESAYQLNHFLTDSGKIKVLDKADIETITSGLKDKIEKFNLENTSTSRKSSFANELFSAFVQGQGNLLDEESLEALLLPQLDIIDKLNYLQSELERKLAENEFIKVHLAVYNNPSVKIQSKINKILSIDYAKEQAEKLEKINSLGEKNKYINERKAEGLSRDEAKLEYEQMNSNFTFLSYAYQKQKMDLGTIGKAAIGVYANFTTLNGLIQQNGSEIFIRDKKGNPKPLTIGNYTAKGILGQEMTVDGSRSIADVLAERENIATDNEKEQVLGRVGVNEQTINVDAYLTLMGFDKDENGNSIPFLMLSQPVIVNLNKQLRDAKGVLGEYINKNELIATNISTLTNGTIIYSEEKGVWKFRNAIDNQEVEDFMGSKLTGKNMLESIEKNDTTSETQAAALMNYVNLEKEVAEVANAQSVVDTNNLGKSIIESQLKYEKLKKITENSVLGNASKLIGDFLSKEMYFTKPEGYYDIGEYWVKPTTPQGQIAITGLQLGHTLFKDFFPYQDTSLTAIVEENLRLSGKDPDKANEESYEEVLTDIKKYLFSSEANNIFEGNAQVKRHETLIDDESNTSLSTYIKDTLRSATNTRGISSLKKNALISSFEFITGKLPGELSLINYSNTSVDNNNQELMYNAIPSLIMSNLKLPNRNGEAYTTRMLAEDLIAYSYLEGGVQEATQFVKFVPVEVLETIGKYEQSRFINAEGKPEARRVFKSANRKLQGLNPNRMNTPEGGENGMFGRLLGLSPVEGSFSTFTKQRFQHNPSLAPKIYSKGITNVNNVEGTFTLKEESKGKNLPFLSMAIKDKGKTSYVLYQNVGAMNYQRISLLGQNGVSEYQYGVLSAFSLGETKIQNLKPNNSLLEGNEAVDLKLEDDTTVGTVLEKIKNLVLSEDFAFITEAAKFLEQFGNPSIKFELGTDITGAGASYKSDLRVKLNPALTTGVSVEKAAVTFLHEYIHTITTRELEKYYDSDFINLRKDVTIPTHVTALHISFSQFRAKYAAEIASMKFKKDNKLSFSEDDKSIYYAGYNIKEFMTMSLTSKNFQDAMSQVPYMKSGVSYLDKILATIMKFMENIYPNLKEGSVAHDAVGKSLRFIEKERAEQQLSYYELLSNSQLSSLDNNRLGIQGIDTSNEVDNMIDNDNDSTNNNAAPIKEGVDSIFSENPELSKIGSQEQYSAYLGTIFPDSEVKEVIAHVSREKGIEKFKANESETGNFINSQVLGSGVYFAPVDMVDYWSMELDFIDDVTGEYTEDRNIYYAVLNSKSPQYTQKNYLENSDTIEGTDVVVNESRSNGNVEEYVVKDPSIIHILGSQEDLKNFTTFVNQDNNQEEKLPCEGGLAI
jgi:predicted SprT family Zn-dependent metalloprotease